MLPIEEGCEAVVFGTKNNDGQNVVVGKFIGSGEHPLFDDLWETDKVMKWSAFYKVSYHHYMPEKYLLRIDGGEFEEEETQELALVLVNSGD